MGVFYQKMTPSIMDWIKEQKMFCVATAPLSGSGHVNVSPKGGKYFGVVDDITFWYLDLTGSGNETISHLLEPGNGRITIMFCAFDGPPKIIRLWGKGVVMERETNEFNQFVETHNLEPTYGTRSIIRVDIHQVGSSCGFSVPYYDFKDFRPILNDFFANKEKKYLAGNEGESMDRYWALKNAWSMDGLPGMRRGLAAGKLYDIKPLKKMVGPLAPTHHHNGTGFAPLQVFLFVLMAFLVGIAVALYGPVLASDALRSLRGTPLDFQHAKHAGGQAFQSMHQRLALAK